MIAIGCDHGGFILKEAVKKHLQDNKIDFIDFGTNSEESVDYAVYAEKVAKSIVNGESELGLLFCGTGVGISMAANKVKGIRAACCSDEFSAEMTRRHNDANILCTGGRVITPEKAIILCDIFINTPFSNEERHVRRINQIKDLEERF